MKTTLGIFKINSQDGSLSFVTECDHDGHVADCLYDYPDQPVVVLEIKTPGKKARPVDPGKPISADQIADRVLQLLEERGATASAGQVKEILGSKDLQDSATQAELQRLRDENKKLQEKLNTSL